LLAASLLLWTSHRVRQLAPGVDLSNESANGKHFSVLRLDLTRASLDLYWKAADGLPLLTFARLSHELERSHNRLIFATNAGIFAHGYVPLGLHVEDGQELVPLNFGSGVGNFYMKPGGVFFIDPQGAHIVDSTHYPGTTQTIRLATQSGPMLFIDGQINPQFRKDSNNAQIRSGVGLLPHNQVVFVLSQEPVTFHQFASFFHDRLGCRQALYLDGTISRVYPGEKPAAGVESNFAGILVISENAQRLPARNSPGPDSQPVANGDKNDPLHVEKP
jgi:uncharacterized protein YigE (DUF2233 family)